MNNIKKLISICIPCFNEEENIKNTYNRLKFIVSSIKKYDFEFVFVDNGSIDKTKNIIGEIAKKDKRIKCIFLSRNFGPEASSKASFDYSSGDAAIWVAADLQEPPELIPRFIEKWEKGCDVVLGQYKKIDDSLFMTWARKSFYKLFKKISNIEVPINVIGFGLYSKKVIVALRSLPEKYRFERGLTMWVGFKKTFIPYERKRRVNGKSSYSLIDYVKHSERGVFGFSYLPLDLLVYIGFILTGLSFLFVIVYLITVLFFGNPINASIPIMLAIVFFGGINMLGLSIIGKYVQVIVEETKNRPVYIVDETVNI